MLGLVAFPILVQLAMPLGLIFWLAVARQPSLAHLALHSLGVGFLCLFLYLAGRWDVVMYPLRYGLPACFAAGLGVAIFRLQSPPLILLARTDDVLRLLVYAVVAVIFAVLVVQCLRGHAHRGAVVDLEFPLREVDWYVVQGGGSSLLNAHRKAPAQALALDIVALDGLGRRAKGLLPRRLEDYQVFDQPVYAPCAGEVVSVEDGLPDLVPPHRDTGHAAGNHVVIACAEARVLLAHLRQGSVLPAVGDRLAAGDLVGNVGNSGNSSEPHLHIHAVRGGVNDETALLRGGEPVAMRFGGRILSRNSRGRG